MCYYQGNEVYNYLHRQNPLGRFFWMSRDKWMLVYGDGHNEPKVVSVVTQGDITEDWNEHEKNALKVAKNIIKNTDVALSFIRYNPEEKLREVRYCEFDKTKPLRESAPEIISMKELKEKFAAFGLHVLRDEVKKGINDKSSSSYHDWQRKNLGSDITVADMDLLRLSRGKDSEGQNAYNVSEIIELKRSGDSLDEWEPYREDYDNFIMLLKLAIKAGIGFYILYNYRCKNPFLDDISRLKLFRFQYKENVEWKTYSELVGYGNMEAFMGGESSAEGFEHGKDENAD